MKQRLVVVGGRGSGEIAMSMFEAANEVDEAWVLEGFLSDIGDPGDLLGRHPIVGGTDEVEDFVQRGYHIHYALHLNAKQKSVRVEKLRSLRIPPEAHASAIHPLAHLDPSTDVGIGIIACPFAATSAGAQIGSFVHVYTGGFVGHDASVGDYATVAAQSIVGGRVEMGEGVHLGLNSSIREDVRIGEYAIIGMGSVVLHEVAPFEIVAGNPARVIGEVERTV